MTSLSTISHPKITFATLVLLVAFVAFRSIETPLSSWPLHNDFAHYYLSSSKLLATENPYSTELEYQKNGFINRPEIKIATNPPALIVALMPIVLFNPEIGFMLWTVLQLLSLWGAIFYAVKIADFNLSLLHKVGLFFAALVTYPCITHLEHGQSQLLISFLITYGIWLLKTEKTSRFGLFLWGLATSLKLFTWPLAIVSFAFAGSLGFLWFVAGFAILNLTAFFVLGAAPFYDFLFSVIPYIASTIFKFNSNNSLEGAIVYSLQAFGSSELRLNLAANFLPILFVSGAAIAFLSVGVLSLRMKASYQDISITIFLVSLICLLFSPTAWAHYMVLTFPILVYLLCLFIKSHDPKLHPVKLLIGYSLVGLTQGPVKNMALEWQLIGAWWGVFTIFYVIFLLFSAKRLQE